MFLGYGNFIIRAVCTKQFENVPNQNEVKKDDLESNRTDALLAS